jgi:long-chain fatty acid transport protein
MKNRLLKTVMITAGLLPGMAAAQLSGLPMAGFTAGGTGLTPFYVLGFELGPWQDYLAQELTPTYMMDVDQVPVRISWLKQEAVMMLPAFAEDLFGGASATQIQFEVEWQMDSATALNANSSLFQSPGLGFERQLLTPGIVHHINNEQAIGVAAVFAYQRYGTSNLGMQSTSQPLGWNQSGPNYTPYAESGYGTGVRLAMQSEIQQGMALNAGYQSRIDMEEFAAYHGVYSQPADLDIPARASVGLALQASGNSWINFSVERVLYSDVNAFASRNLPDRFLSLLGDSTSPSFDWDDLTVYSVGWAWNGGDGTEWRLDFSSRAQPTPNSQSLSQALSGELADNAMTVGYSTRTSSHSRFNFNAAYAPAEFAFGGSVLGVTSDELDQNFELEAVWTLDF